MKCFTCTEKTGDYKRDKLICARCREVLKVDLVNMVLELDPVYLSEANRNKGGRKPKLTADQMNRLYYDHMLGGGVRRLAKQYGVRLATVSRIINKK